MKLKVIESISRFYLGQALYPNALEPIAAYNKPPFINTCNFFFDSLKTPSLLLLAITPLSKTLKSFGYRPLSPWQGRAIYLSPFILKGVELLVPEDHKVKVQVLSRYYHRMIQITVALAVLRIAQKEGMHQILGIASGVSYVFLCRNGYLTSEQQKVIRCSMIILSGGMAFLKESELGGKMLAVVTTTVDVSLSIMMPKAMPVLVVYVNELQTIKVEPDDDSVKAQIARDVQKKFPERLFDDATLKALQEES